MQTTEEILTRVERETESAVVINVNIAYAWREFGKAVCAARKKRGETLKQIGKKIGISEGHMSRLERGKNGWSFKLARKAIEALNPATNG
jgi:DNA-binding XRE family transcriptional regulator